MDRWLSDVDAVCVLSGARAALCIANVLRMPFSLIHIELLLRLKTGKDPVLLSVGFRALLLPFYRHL